MKCLINVEGGMGKNVMLTSILPLLKEKYDEIYVISPYHDIFKACSYVTDAFQPGQGSLYQELVLDDDCDVLWKEPYSNQKFIKKQCHLFEAWLEEFGIEYDGDVTELVPNLDRIEQEYPLVKKAVEQTLDTIGDKFILVQFCGSHSPLTPLKDPTTGQDIVYNEREEVIKRNYFQGQEVINKLKEEYPEYKIIHYALPNEQAFDGAEKLTLPYLAYHLLAKYAFKVICIDSSLQHLVTGVCNNVTVIWGETRPEHFGYKCNKNVCAKDVKNLQPYFKPLGVSPSLVKMPSPEEVLNG